MKNVVLFFEFLQERNLFDVFIKNVKRADVLYNHPIESDIPHCFVSSYFTWSETEQGFDFWNDIEDAWIRHFETIINK